MPSDSMAMTRPGKFLSLGRCVAVANGAAILALVVHFGFYLRYGLSAVQFPFGLDYGEGIIWQQALFIPTERMYGDITRFPFIVFHYPPLYHLAVRAVIALGGDALVAGRGISLSCTLLTGVLVAGLTYDVVGHRVGRIARLAGATVAGLTVFCYWPVVLWSPDMRVDMLATMLTCLGAWLSGRSFQRPWLLYLAVLSFVLAVYTKQSSIAAPLAVLLVFLVVDRRRALAAFGFGLFTGLIALAVLTAATDGGFLRHLLLYNLNRFSLGVAMTWIGRESAAHALFLGMAVAGLVVGWQELRKQRDLVPRMSFWRQIGRDPAGRLMTILTIWLVLATGMLVAVGKSGAAQNYFIEWMCLWSMMIGILVAFMSWRVFSDPELAREPILMGRRLILTLIVPAALIIQTIALPASKEFGDSPERIRQLDALVARIRDATSPVLSDDMVLLLRAGKQVPWEPAIFAELASRGLWDERPILNMIEHRRFAFLITEGHPGDLIYDSRFTPAVDRTMRVAYPRTEILGDRILHLPPD
jgi:hypothetical protein